MFITQGLTWTEKCKKHGFTHRQHVLAHGGEREEDVVLQPLSDSVI